MVLYAIIMLAAAALLGIVNEDKLEQPLTMPFPISFIP